MPVRSLSSSILKWPDAETVRRAAAQWAREAASGRGDVVCIGCFGSYARGDAGVGSDLDLLVVVATSEAPFERRGLDWPTASLPVPADVLVYTRDEWARIKDRPGFGRRIAEELVTLFP